MNVVNKYTFSYYAAEEAHLLVDIMRPNPLGNPYVIGKDGSREKVIAKFEQFARQNSSMLQKIFDLPENATLICCCKPNPCHGDIIMKIWKEMHDKQS